jgi:hypothetical protein
MTLYQGIFYQSNHSVAAAKGKRADFKKLPKQF